MRAAATEDMDHRCDGVLQHPWRHLDRSYSAMVPLNIPSACFPLHAISVALFMAAVLFYKASSRVEPGAHIPRASAPLLLHISPSTCRHIPTGVLFDLIAGVGQEEGGGAEGIVGGAKHGEAVPWSGPGRLGLLPWRITVHFQGCPRRQVRHVLLFPVFLLWWASRWC